MTKSFVAVSAKNEEQKEMLRTISKNFITFVKGLAGTGKTHVSVGFAIQELLKNKYDNIILSRPVVEAGEKLGFLPGDMEDKINPYMIPVFTAMEKILGDSALVRKLTNKNGSNPKIRILPLAFMRGVSFDHSIVVLDEMQNSTPEQMRMVLTRLGENSKMIVCGDTEQSDLKNSNGLENAFKLLAGIEGIGFCSLSSKAIVRHPIIEKIEERYSKKQKEK